MVSALGKITVETAFRAEVIENTVLVQLEDDLAWQQLRETITLTAGSRIATGATSRAFIQLSDGSTLYLYNNTDLRVERSVRGWIDSERTELILRMYKGRILVGVASNIDESKRQFRLYANQGSIRFAAGSYHVELLSQEVTEVMVRSGEALLTNQGDLTNIGIGGRGVYSGKLPPQGDVAPNTPLLKDTEMEEMSSTSPWQPFVTTETGVEGQTTKLWFDSNPTGPFAKTRDSGYRFHRRAIQNETVNRHGEAGIFQIVGRDIRDYSLLMIRARLRVRFQSLSGGGSAGTEYPIMLRLFYSDENGQDQIWYHGFYYQNDDGFSVAGASPVGRDAWVTYENPNLLHAIYPPPAFINRVEILGSGWEWDSETAELSLEGR